MSRRGRKLRNVTLRDVARVCGLSVYPVSRVLNGKYATAPETAEKIRRVAAELGYSHARNDLARRLSLRKSGKTTLNHVVGLLMPNHLEKVNFSKGARVHPESERLGGYRQACREAGVSLDDCLIPVPLAYDHLAEKPLRDAVMANRDATALLAHNDPIAVMACYVLQGLGRCVPEDFSVVGWDDTDPFPDAAGRNQLTSIGFDVVDLGRRAARLLIARIERRQSGDVTVLVAPSLAVRGTTAPPRRRA